mgnify:CR=1
MICGLYKHIESIKSLEEPYLLSRQNIDVGLRHYELKLS